MLGIFHTLSQNCFKVHRPIFSTFFKLCKFCSLKEAHSFLVTHGKFTAEKFSVLKILMKTCLATVPII